MNSHSHNITDALIYIRESMNTHITSIYDALAASFGTEEIDGEEYLPDPLSEVMMALTSMLRETTDLCVSSGIYQRQNGTLLRPRCYANGQPVYADSDSSPGERSATVHQIQHPLHAEVSTEGLQQEGGRTCA